MGRYRSRVYDVRLANVRIVMKMRLALAAFVLIVASGCGGRSESSLPPAGKMETSAISPRGIVSPIQHVVNYVSRESHAR